MVFTTSGVWTKAGGGKHKSRRFKPLKNHIQEVRYGPSMAGWIRWGWLEVIEYFGRKTKSSVKTWLHTNPFECCPEMLPSCLEAKKRLGIQHPQPLSFRQTICMARFLF